MARAHPTKNERGQPLVKLALKMGFSAAETMTAEEARKLADELDAAADKIEGKVKK